MGFFVPRSIALQPLGRKKKAMSMFKPMDPLFKALAFVISGGEEKLIAMMSGTLLALFDRAGIRRK